MGADTEPDPGGNPLDDPAFVAEVVDEGGVPFGYLAIVAWTEPDGTMTYRVVDQLDLDAATILGLLELAKRQVVGYFAQVDD